MGLETLAGIAAKRFIGRVADHYADRLTSKVSLAPSPASIDSAFDEERIEAMLRTHLLDASRWAQEVQIYVMAAPRDTSEITLALDLVNVPRKLRPPSLGTSGDAAALLPLRDEQAILDSPDCQVLLGDPGAGKTTTVKRLVNTLLSAPEVEADDGWSVPIVVRLREHATLSSVVDVLVGRLGISQEMGQLNPTPPAPPPAYVDDPDLTNDENDDRRQERERERSLPLARQHEAEARGFQLLAMLLDRCGAVVFLDGLDEVRPGVRAELEASIEQLGRLLSLSKIVVSCRSGDYNSTIGGFSVLEISPLTPQQVSEIAGRWLGSGAEHFLHEIRKGAAEDLANRPLFLCQMLALYANTEAIPDQPSSLCRQMVRLAIQDWDRQRRTIRTTKYKGFDADSKLEFLANLAYKLTFEYEATQLTHEALVRCYDEMREAFDLPPNEAEQVALELEAHNGLIVQAGYQVYEFSHLSVQEYLAAEHLIRGAARFALIRIYDKSPSTVAVSVALSSDPATYLAQVAGTTLTNGANNLLLPAFLERLIQERPRLVPGEALGCATLWLVFKSWSHSPEAAAAIGRFFDYPGVAASLRQVLHLGYTVVQRRGISIRLARRDSYYPGPISAPDSGDLPVVLAPLLDHPEP